MLSEPRGRVYLLAESEHSSLSLISSSSASLADLPRKFRYGVLPLTGLGGTSPSCRAHRSHLRVEHRGPTGFVCKVPSGIQDPVNDTICWALNARTALSSVLQIGVQYHCTEYASACGQSGQFCHDGCARFFVLGNHPARLWRCGDVG